MCGRQQVLSLVNLVAVQLFLSCVVHGNKQEEEFTELIFLFFGPFGFHRFYKQRRSLVNVSSLVANPVSRLSCTGLR